MRLRFLYLRVLPAVFLWFSGTALADADRASVTHRFTDITLRPFQEVQNCVAWTLNNAKALYVQGVRLANAGSFHHSNWFVVPEDTYAGPDGFFRCADREFGELEAALAGTVLYAQSTQARLENQQMPDGVVIRIPPRHKVVAGVHLLNLSSASTTTHARITLDIIHPRQVTTILSPLNLGYFDLHIPPGGQSYHSVSCNLNTWSRLIGGRALDMKLYWMMPHTHSLGNYFRLELAGGSRDGEVIAEVRGFNADTNGVAFNPPVDFTGATGLRLTCGFNNTRDVEVGWGVGDQEMCQFLGLVESPVLIQGGAVVHDPDATIIDGATHFDSSCLSMGFAKQDGQILPGATERAESLYVPPTAPRDEGLTPEIGCIDTAELAGPAEPVLDLQHGETDHLLPDLRVINSAVFQAGCTFSSCHDGEGPAAGLDLTGDLHGALVNVPSRMVPGALLVSPGAPAESVLYRMLSECRPEMAGVALPHMPLNSPTLLDPGLVVTVREWIELGARP